MYRQVKLITGVLEMEHVATKTELIGNCGRFWEWSIKHLLIRDFEHDFQTAKGNFAFEILNNFLAFVWHQDKETSKFPILLIQP